jgi:rsbT antagonist protein RsbS
MTVMARDAVARIPLQLASDCVVASIQIDLDSAVLEQFRRDLLALLRDSGAKGVILDVSGLEIMDLEDFEALRRTIAMAAIMGAETVVAGFQPGVVSSLVELDANVESIRAALNLDDAFRVIADHHGESKQPDNTSSEHDDEPQADPDENSD